MENIVVLILEAFQFESHLWNFMSCSDEMLYRGNHVSWGKRKQEEKIKMTLWLWKSKIDSFRALFLLNIFRLSGYIEYLRMASYLSLKFLFPNTISNFQPKANRTLCTSIEKVDGKHSSLFVMFYTYFYFFVLPIRQ